MTAASASTGSTAAPSVHPDVPLLTFLGAAGTVTGSRFLLETRRARVLIDCGLFQGLKALRLRNWDRFPVDVAGIDAVVISHAHIDHVGYLPVLTSAGFAGPVHTTAGTRELAGIVLPDSGHLQEEEASYANRRGFSKHHPALPLYTEEDARTALRQFRSHDYGAEFEAAPGVFVTFKPAGHILGSSTVTVRLADDDDRTVVFSGDLGRPHHPVLKPPAPIGAADIVVMESTYGNRLHDDADAIERFADAIVRTIARGGMVLIPAFAVDRTEVILHHLRRLVLAGKIPAVPVYVDSPMAISALTAYRDAIERGDPEIQDGFGADGDPFDTGQVTEVREAQESMALANLYTPSIIVSAAGMASGGRVLHHLARLLPDHRNSVLLVGYQAQGTRGRLLADGAESVKLLGRHVRVRADIVDLGAFSIHADQHELVAWLGTADRVPDAVYLVHGEPESAAALATVINERDDWLAVVARDGEQVRLDAAAPPPEPNRPLPPPREERATPAARPAPVAPPVEPIRLAVVGQQLRGEPRHDQLTDLDAELVGLAHTADCYRLYALAADPPAPGLARVADGSGASIEVEVYALAPAAFARFVAGVASPQGVGRILLDDGSEVPGVLCEPYALDGATDISEFGAWRAYRHSLPPAD
ncbi:MAG: MBL fold metallo-hydrolase [Acidimicrobiales bacterium]